MATEKNISSRIIHKHDIEANWNKATNFIPKAGEIIVYDKDETYDYERFKIGDGETAVTALSFGSIQSDWNQKDEGAIDYIKNRPFGTQETATISIPEASYSNNASFNSSVVCSEAGTYRITVDNENIYLYQKQWNMYQVNGAILGDSQYTEIPIYIQYNGPMSKASISFQDGMAHIVKVELLKTVVKPLDAQFVPNEIARVTYVDSQIDNHEHDWNDITENRPFYYDENLVKTIGTKTVANGDLWSFLEFDPTTYRVTFDNSDIYIIKHPTGYNDIGDAQFSKYPFYYDYPYFYFQDEQSHTVKIEKITINHKTLDEIFIPDTIARVSDILTEDEVVQISIAPLAGVYKEAFKKATAAIENGKIVIGHYNIPKTVNGAPSGSCLMYLSDDKTYLSGTIPCTNGNFYFEISEVNAPIGSFMEPTENSMHRLTTWDSAKTGSEEHYPSVKAMEEYVGIQIAESGKQDKLSGAAGQVVGFDAEGNAVAQDNPQPNWNQNDENAPDYVKNRPFYTIEGVETVFLDEITINARNGSTGLFTLPASFQSNQTYKVIWDGTPYICQTYFVTPFQYVIGNVSLSPSAGGSGGNGEPFMIGEVMGNSVIFVSSSGTHTFSIFSLESETVIVKLPIEYHQNSNILNGSNDGAVKTIGAWDASGWYSFAEGNSTTASGAFSHAEGHETDATGAASHAEGYKALASGNYSHAEGHSTQALEDYAHAEGSGTYATGEASHAEGHGTYATGDYSHAEGYRTTAASEYQHAQGRYNVNDSLNTYAHIVGNGLSDTNRSNAHTIDWDGNAWFQGDVYVSSTSGTNKDEGSKKLATETYVNEVVGDSLANIEPYIFNIDYDTLLSFNTSEIVFNNTTSVLGTAILGQMILA